jgi:predicted enzyme related to lactoylglutathione lyase
MLINNALASVAVKDIGAAVAWYEALLGRSADSTPMPEIAEWKFDSGGWLQVYQLPERAGTGSCTLAVSNIEEVMAHVQKLGINADQRSSGAKVKTLMIVALDGNHIAFAQAIDKSMAR